MNADDFLTDGLMRLYVNKYGVEDDGNLSGFGSSLKKLGKKLKKAVKKAAPAAIGLAAGLATANPQIGLTAFGAANTLLARKEAVTQELAAQGVNVTSAEGQQLVEQYVAMKSAEQDDTKKYLIYGGIGLGALILVAALRR